MKLKTSKYNVNIKIVYTCKLTRVNIVYNTYIYVDCCYKKTVFNLGTILLNTTMTDGKCSEFAL